MKRHSTTIEGLLNEIVSELTGACRIIEQLQRDGYSQNFVLSMNEWKCVQTGQRYHTSEIRVDDIYKFVDRDGILDRVYLYVITQLRDDEKGLAIIDLTDENLFTRR